MTGELAFGVSEFVAYINQTFEYAYPFVSVEGEVSGLRISRGKWVYFDLKDEAASLKCFGVIHMLPGPVEEGMRIRVSGTPRLHPLYNFSFQTQRIELVGEGSFKKSFELLRRKLEAEGLFDLERKRNIVDIPKKIALITAKDSAAQADFVKIASARWGGVVIEHFDTLVQGDSAPTDIVRALQRANEGASLADVIVLTRGGGSADDLAAFNDERVVRAVAASRVPTVVAIGHESDWTLSELVADLRASTPSNAAELILPDKEDEKRHLRRLAVEIDQVVADRITACQTELGAAASQLDQTLLGLFEKAEANLAQQISLLGALDPLRPLTQGYAVIRSGGTLVRSVNSIKAGDELAVEMQDGVVAVKTSEIIKKKDKQ